MAAAQSLWRPSMVFGSAALLRFALLLWGSVQDARSPLKYTDIDYNVFTDASRFLAEGASPYERATYRYTPLLAWLLLPTAWTAVPLSFTFGKLLFALSDLLSGWLIWTILKGDGLSSERALKFAAIWLLNPMVANISTRGSSEGLLLVVVLGVLWAALQNRHVAAGSLLGIAVHLKIYPFIYGASLIWWLGRPDKQKRNHAHWAVQGFGVDIMNTQQIVFLFSSAFTFAVFNIAMYSIYGYPFLEHTFFYHLGRLDHRHNFSPYNILLYLNASPAAEPGGRVESLAFFPQLLLSAIAMPLILARKDLASCMLVQTLTFVAFNKVCTAQYFMWFMVFLPLYLPRSSLLAQPGKGISVLAAWVMAQALWLQQAFSLEHLQQSTFFPGLWSASLLLFAVHVIIIAVFIDDMQAVAAQGGLRVGKS